ncbi:MAG: aspartyl protease family protein [Altibacter sp.]|nr:aspartyl protease family protein [Altibacter sp.]
MKTFSKIRLLSLIVGILIALPASMVGQDGFALPDGTTKDKIDFELVNNLVVVPVTINGTEFSFLLDTGVNTTILFGLSQEDTLQLNNASTIRIRGLGEGGSIEALKTENNKVTIGNAIDEDHTIYVIFEQSLNLSPRMGLPIHGIIGYDFFKRFIVKTDYTRKRLTIYDPEQHTLKVCKRCSVLELSMYENRPYVDIEVFKNGSPISTTMLLDSGSSDAIWLFDETIGITESPKNYFIDFLGLGLSGNIFGKRSKLEEISFSDFTIKDVNVSYPSLEALNDINFYKDRKGSIGGDLLRRFTVTIDYASKRLLLKKNSTFNDKFHYNMSGLTVEHEGISVIREERKVDNSKGGASISVENDGSFQINYRTVFDFILVPRYIVAELREDSPAALAGVEKNDEIISINGRPAYKYKLYEIVALFSSEEGKRIKLQIERNGVKFIKKFDLKEVL